MESKEFLEDFSLFSRDHVVFQVQCILERGGAALLKLRGLDSGGKVTYD